MDDLNNPKEPLIIYLRHIIHFAVRFLAIMMTLVILWGVVDVGYVLYQKLLDEPFMMLTISDILATFGAFMAVLIAIEIFVNINIYLREDVIHVKIVIATALMAIARKVIILDYNDISAEYVWATAGVVLAMSIAYWMVHKFAPNEISFGNLAKNKLDHQTYSENALQQKNNPIHKETVEKGEPS
jgi:uncharacterized membrane protein (DUF373 family)